MKKIISLLLTTLLACSSLNIHAQTSRRIPANAKSATLNAVNYPAVVLGNVEYRLSPGSRIFLPNNTIAQPHAAPTPAAVKYFLDTQGMVQTIWILTPQELASN